MADPFVVYTMGDTNLFMFILNGIAMLFSGSDLFAGDGAMGLGFGAFFGAVVLTLIMIYNAVFKKQLEFRLLLAPLILYVVITGPKVDVALEDIYSQEAVKRVDNIPIGLALPLSVASGIGLILTQAFETVYQVVSNDQDMMPRLTDSGYVTPLKLLNSLRTAASNEGSSNLFETTKNFYANCITNNPNFNAEQYIKSPEPLEYLVNVTQGNGGLTWIKQEGTSEDNPKGLVTCGEASNILRYTMDSMMSGIKNSQDKYNIIGDVSKYNLRTIINGEMVSNGSASGVSPKGSIEAQNAGVSGYTYDDVRDAFASIAGLSEAQARNFIAATMFNQYMKSAAHCSDLRSGDINGMAKCTAWVSSVNQWEEKNAASATGFLKILQDAQNLIVMISIIVFPIIVLLIMFQGVAAFKAVGDYIIFMVAGYMWMPIATVLNFYIQSSIQEEYLTLMTTMGGNGLSLYTASQFYGAVSQKLALANGFLSLTPILCYLIFKGMSMGMSYMNAKMNSADGGGYDAKVNSPDIQKSAAMATSNSALNVSGQNVVTETGKMQTSLASSNAYSTSQQIGQEISKANSEANSAWNALGAMQAATGTRANTETTAVSNSESSTSGEMNSKTTQRTQGNETSSQSNKGDGVTVTSGSSEVSADTDATVVQGGVNAGITGKPNLGNKENGKNANKDADDKKSLLSGAVGAGASGGISKVGTDATTTSKSLNVGNTEQASFNGVKAEKTALTANEQEGFTNAFNTIKSNEDRVEYLKREEVKNALTQEEGTKVAYEKALSAANKAIQTQQQAQNIALSIGGNISEMMGSMRESDMNGLRAAVANSEDKEGIQATQERFMRNGSIKGQDAANAGLLIGALASSDQKVREAAAAIFAPETVKSYQQNAEQIKDIPTERPTEKNFIPINDAGLDPQRANNLNTSQVKTPSGIIPTVTPASLPTKVAPVPTVNLPPIPNKDNASEAIERGKGAAKNVREVVEKR